MPLNIAGTVVRSSFLAGLPNSGIVTRGLVLDIDAGNIASYSGSGTVAYSLTGTYITGTHIANLNNGTTYSTANGGEFSFDGTNDQIVVPSSSNFNLFNTDYAIEIAIFLNSSESSSNKYNTAIYVPSAPLIIGFARSGLVSGVPFIYTAQGGIPGFASTNYSPYTYPGTEYNPAGKWTIITLTKLGSIDYIYINGTQYATKTWAGTISNSSSVVELGFNSTYQEYLAGKIGSTRIYNRGLTAQEVAQNFNSTRNRFGV